MQKRSIHITRTDLERLRAHFSDCKDSGVLDAAYVKDLEGEIRRAVVVDAKAVPHDVITLRSRVVLKDLDDGEEATYTLVYPEESDPASGRISILSPVGTAMLGCRVGDTFEWKVPRGNLRMQVLRIEYQPEAAGDYHL